MSKKEKKAVNRIYDMTQGNATKQILLFMIPLMGGNVLQQMYTVTDAVILVKGVLE